MNTLRRPVINLPTWALEACPSLARTFSAQTGYREMVSIGQLAEARVMGELLDDFEVCYPGCNRAAVASQWQMNFLSVLVPAVVVPPLTLGRALDLEDRDLALLHDQAQPMAIRASRPSVDSRPGQWPEYWQTLISTHLEPVITAVAQSGGLAPKVLWNNVVVVWDEVFRRIGLHLTDQSIVESAHQWLSGASVRGGRLKLRPLQRWVGSPAPELVDRLPLRRHCCLHYQLHEPVPDEFPVWCESCPKLHREPAAEQVRYLYQLQEEAEEEDEEPNEGHARESA